MDDTSETTIEATPGTEEGTEESTSVTPPVADTGNTKELQAQLESARQERQKATETSVRQESEIAKLTEEKTTLLTQLDTVKAELSTMKESLNQAHNDALDSRKKAMVEKYGLEAKILVAMDSKELDAVELTRPAASAKGFGVNGSGNQGESPVSAREKIRQGLEASRS